MKYHHRHWFNGETKDEYVEGIGTFSLIWRKNDNNEWVTIPYEETNFVTITGGSTKITSDLVSHCISAERCHFYSVKELPYELNS